jgi:hypothetical protein
MIRHRPIILETPLPPQFGVPVLIAASLLQQSTTWATVVFLATLHYPLWHTTENGLCSASLWRMKANCALRAQPPGCVAATPNSVHPVPTRPSQSLDTPAPGIATRFHPLYPQVDYPHYPHYLQNQSPLRMSPFTTSLRQKITTRTTLTSRQNHKPLSRRRTA